MTHEGNQRIRFGRHVAALLGLVWEERRLYALGLVFVGIGIVTALVYPQVVRITIDEGIQGGHPDRINRLALLMLGLLVAEGIGVFVRDYFFNLAAERVSARLRQRAFEHLLKQEIAFFDSRSTGAITTRLWSEIPNIQLLVGDQLADAVRFTLYAMGGTVLLFYTSPLLTLLVMLAVPPLVAAVSFLGQRVKRSASQVQHAYAETGTVAEESIAGIRTVRAFSQEAAEGARHRHKLAAAIDLARWTIAGRAAGSSLSFVVGEGSALLALWVGGVMIVHGRLTTGALLSFVLYAFLVARGFRSASQFWTEALRTLGATEWVFDLLERKPGMPLNGGDRLAHLGGTVALEDVRFTYPTRPDIEALSGVDLEIRSGEVVAFVGRSGAGKSSVLNLLLRFYDPAGGRILLDGRDIRDLDATWLRGQMGMVLQEPVLFSRSIAENIRYGRLEADDEEIEEAAELACAREFIERFPDRYATQIGDRGVQLSGGQRQRLAIARAVLRRPKILLLDEATSALDAESEAFVQQALRVLDYKPTTLIVAHRLSTVVKVDRVVVIDQGRIISAGPHDQLLQTCEFYRQLVETQLVPV